MSKVNEKLVSIGLLWLRVFMGTGIAYHGYVKIFGGNMDKLIQGVSAMGMPLPEISAWIAALSEFAGGILVAFGLFTRHAAFFILCTMSVAAFIVHGDDPFSSKELALAYWTMSATLIFTGAGSLSVDRKMSN